MLACLETKVAMEPTQKLLGEAQRLISEGRSHEASFMLEKSVIESLNLLAMIQCDQGREEDAIRLLNSSIQIDKSAWLTYSNFAHVLNTFGHHKEALEVIERAIRYSSGEAYVPLFNCGVILVNLLRYEEAIGYYKRATQVDPQMLIARYNLAGALLTIGRFEEGWSNYDARLGAFEKTKQFRARFKQQDWDGVPLDGKKLCVYSEQGVGDLIMFLRFLPRLRNLGGSIVLEIQEPTEQLVKKSFPDFEVKGRGDAPNFGEPPWCDCVVSICSLPKILKLNQRNDLVAEPYIHSSRPAPKSWFKSSKKDCLKVGFSWVTPTTPLISFAHAICLPLVL